MIYIINQTHLQIPWIIKKDQFNFIQLLDFRISVYGQPFEIVSWRGEPGEPNYGWVYWEIGNVTRIN